MLYAVAVAAAAAAAAAAVVAAAGVVVVVDPADWTVQQFSPGLPVSVKTLFYCCC